MNIHRKRITALCLASVLLLTAPGCRQKSPDNSEPDKSGIATKPEIPTLLWATVTSRELNVRSGMGYESEVVGTLRKGQTVTILERAQLDGVSWGRTEDGWICLLYVSMEELPEGQIPETDPPAPDCLYTAAIIVKSLNIRSGPSAKDAKNGTYSWGETVKILEEQDGWGRTDTGWIKLSYVNREDDPQNVNQQVRVIAETLNVRNGPGTSYDLLGKLASGDQLTILKEDRFDGVRWGYTGTGWVCMDYVKAVNP